MRALHSKDYLSSALLHLGEYVPYFFSNIFRDATNFCQRSTSPEPRRHMMKSQGVTSFKYKQRHCDVCLLGRTYVAAGRNICDCWEEHTWLNASSNSEQLFTSTVKFLEKFFWFLVPFFLFFRSFFTFMGEQNESITK